VVIDGYVEPFTPLGTRNTTASGGNVGMIYTFGLSVMVDGVPFPTVTAKNFSNRLGGADEACPFSIVVANMPAAAHAIQIRIDPRINNLAGTDSVSFTQRQLTARWVEV
jgi:hypothetical protein